MDLDYQERAFAMKDQSVTVKGAWCSEFYPLHRVSFGAVKQPGATDNALPSTGAG